MSLLIECVALFDYVGVEGDLTFNEGDVIKITKKETDWWEGVLRGECGFFPANYVKVKEQTEVGYLFLEIYLPDLNFFDIPISLHNFQWKRSMEHAQF